MLLVYSRRPAARSFAGARHGRRRAGGGERLARLVVDLGHGGEPLRPAHARRPRPPPARARRARRREPAAALLPALRSRGAGASRGPAAAAPRRRRPAAAPGAGSGWRVRRRARPAARAAVAGGLGGGPAGAAAGAPGDRPGRLRLPPDVGLVPAHDLRRQELGRARPPPRSPPAAGDLSGSSSRRSPG